MARHLRKRWKTELWRRSLREGKCPMSPIMSLPIGICLRQGPRFTRDGEVTFQKELSSSSSYFEIRNLETLRGVS